MISPTFATNLRSTRLRLHLSAQAAASLCGVSRATWYGYESGDSTPTLAGLADIARKLKTTPARLLKDIT